MRSRRMTITSARMLGTIMDARKVSALQACACFHLAEAIVPALEV